MPQLDREGRFKAAPIDWMVKQVNDRPMFQVTYKILSHHVNGEWEDWSSYDDYVIEAPYWLFKTDGSVNKFAQDSLKECFGWSGTSLADLDQGHWSDVVVQIVCDWDTYKNQQRLVVKFTNPGDSQPQTKLAPEKLKAMDRTWGAKLLATAGPVTSPQSRPATPARRTGRNPVVPPGLQPRVGATAPVVEGNGSDGEPQNDEPPPSDEIPF